MADVNLNEDPEKDSDFEDMEDEASENESMESVDEEDDELTGDQAEEREEGEEHRGQVYLPGAEVNPDEDGELECDESAYVLYHQATTVAPCLSFDIIQDTLGDNRGDCFPLTAYIVAGTQAERNHLNNIILMKMSNMQKVKTKNEDEDSGESESEDEDDKPELETALVPHQGCINRIRVTNYNENMLAATWSETGKVYLWHLNPAFTAVNNPSAMTRYVQSNLAPKPVFSFAGHLREGFALDWSPTVPGYLATGDCNKNIHVWKPQESTWHVDQRAFTGHTASVEDIQWSPNEATVMASCSVDKSIRIWDTRAAPNKACMLTTEAAHEADVNVISWNRVDPFLVSGGDDGVIKVWDLRHFQTGKAVAIFKHHTAPITSVEWHPTDSTVFAASGSDDQLTLWDLAVEKDQDTDDGEELEKIPPQLLFIHQGQKDIKELHWHPQMPGVVFSTAHSGFNVFRTISV